MPSDSTRDMQRYRWLIFALLSSSYILVYFHRLCVSALAVDLMRDLGAGGSLIGLLGAAYFYSYALMQLPAGLLSDSWGARKTITVFFIVAFSGSIILGLSPTVTWAIAGRTLVGIGVAMLFVPTLKILSEWFRPQEFARMTGILLGMGGIGSLIAATPLVWLSNRVGWRHAFLFVGVATLCLAVLVWVFVRNRPSDKGWPSVAEPVREKEPAIGMAQAVKKVFTCRHFWPLAVWFFFNFAVLFSFGGLWGGPYLKHVYGMSGTEAGRILSMMALGLVVGGPLLSWMSDRVFRRRKPVLVLTSIAMVLMTGLVVFCAAIPVWGLYLFFFMITVCGNASGVIAFTMNKELFPISITGTATGLVNLFPFIGGAVFQPFLGYLLERPGIAGGAFTAAAYQSAFTALFVCAWIALAAALCARETMGRRGTD
jgi:sugar phosphate permease